MDSKIYKDQYEFEWNHRSHLTSALNIPIAVATLLGGALVTLFQKFPFAKDIPTYLFSAFALFSTISLVTAVIFIFRAVRGYKYQRIPTPTNIKKHYNDLKDWWSRNNGSEKDAQKDLNDYINERLSEAVERNSVNNKNKSAYIYKTNSALISSLVFIALCTMPYLVRTINNISNTVKVEIINPEFTLLQKEEKIMNDNDNNPSNEKPNDDPKPTGPPNQEIKEDKVITTTREMPSPQKNR
ncbi:MAG: hypothetical protein GY874_11965 [Desulfobacteraceae bacterium]|nr:hypothetical protein [Desulfobacteraceae bacterium]